MERIYVEELQELTGITFLSPYKNLTGKGQDGITEAQKRALRKFGVNSTGFKYKAEACRAIAYLSARAERGLKPIWLVAKEDIKKESLTKNLRLFAVKKITKNGNTYSPEWFITEGEADYHAAKMVKPEFDAKVITVYPQWVWVVQTKKPRFFRLKEDAQKIAAVHHCKYQLWK